MISNLKFLITVLHIFGTTCSTQKDVRTHSPSLETQKKKYATLPETNMAPENNPLEKENPIGNHHF